MNLNRSSNKNAKRILQLIGALLFSATSLMSLQQVMAAENTALSPPDPNYITDVYIDIWDVKIFRIDENEDIFEVEATIDALWLDERQQFEASEADMGSKLYEGLAAEEALKTFIWWPNFDVSDSRGPRDIINQSVSISSDGSVYYRERFTAEIIQPYNLERFPYDTQEISFTVRPFSPQEPSNFNFASFEDSPREPSSWEPNEWITSDLTFVVTSGYCPDSPEYGQEYSDCENGDFVFSASHSTATLSMNITREPRHYETNYIIPILLIVMISSAVFYMGFESMHLGDRLSVSFTSVLTIVAFDFVASENLPRLWYSTGIDSILTAAYIFLALNVLENVVVSRMHLNRQDTALRIDQICRWAYPLAFILTVGIIIISLST